MVLNNPNRFAPLCTEKIMIKEDIELDPIIGLTIKTNQYGMHPVWYEVLILVHQNFNSSVP
jgi:hypothetical protein